MMQLQQGENYHHLFYEKFCFKLEKELCFSCDKKYFSNHEYWFRQFKVIISLEDDKDREEEINDDIEAIVEERKMELSLNSSFVVRLDTLLIMKFTETMKGKDMIILLDSKMTHNFISKKLMKELKLSTILTRFVITLGIRE